MVSESKFATGSWSQGPRSNNGLPLSSRKTFITAPRSPLAEKANCGLRKLMALKLSIYLGLSPLCEMPQKVPVSLFLSEEERIQPEATHASPLLPLAGQARGWDTNVERDIIILDHPNHLPESSM